MQLQYMEWLRDVYIYCLPRSARRRYFRDLALALEAGQTDKKIEPELLLLHTYLDPAKTFFDVGAHMGSYVYAASQHLAPDHIYAFEPQRRYARRLRALFPRVHVEQCALSDHVGTAVLKTPRIRGSVYSTRATLGSFTEEGEDGAEHTQVPLRTLDDAASGAGPVSCIKIDAEGHELQVLEGARRTLQTYHPVLIVEIEQRHHVGSIEGVFSWLGALGYSAQVYDAALGRLRPRVPGEGTPFTNFIFTPRA